MSSAAGRPGSGTELGYSLAVTIWVSDLVTQFPVVKMEIKSPFSQASCSN